LDADIEFWPSVKDTNEPEELKACLTAYPPGQFKATVACDVVRHRWLSSQVAKDGKTIIMPIRTPPPTNGAGGKLI
jgi:hypothetical protein